MKNKKTIGLIVVLAIVLVFAVILAVNAITGDNNKTVEENPVASQAANSELNEENDTTPSFQGDAYNFQLVDTEGNTHLLEQYSGKQVYLKFWATWCPSCIDGLDELNELHEQTKDRDDIVILTIVAPGYSGEKSSAKFIEWYKEQELVFTVLLDEGGNSFFEYGIRAVPSSFYIDTKGNITESKLGHVGNDKIFETLESVQ